MTTQEEIIDFALWMFNRQTVEERGAKVSISKNDIGFNSPDSISLTNLLICLKDKVPYSKAELRKIAFTILKPKLIKYERQYNEYIKIKAIGR